MEYTAVRMGAKYAGTCVVCGHHTGDRSWELAATVLCTDAHGTYAVCHGHCCPCASKGFRDWRLSGKTTFTVR